MARAMAEAGTTIPEDTSSDLWSRYPIRKNGVALEEAQQFGRSLRTRHKELLQDEVPEISTTAFLQDNTDIVRNYFDAYIIPLAEACFSGINNGQMRTLAGTISMCAKSIELSTQVRLQRIATGMDFTNEDAVLMESMIRYALVEELRKKLPEHISRQRASEEVHSYEVTHIMAPPSRRHINFRCYDYDMHAMNMRTARNINGGVQAGRSYGGCSVASPKAKSYGEDSDVPKKQDVFGGVTNQDEEGGDEEDKFGSLRFQCKKGHWNTRPRNKLIPKCKTCGDSVKC
jgi:hypothetical protein